MLEGLAYLLIFIISFDTMAIASHLFRIFFDNEEYFEPEYSFGEYMVEENARKKYV